MLKIKERLAASGLLFKDPEDEKKFRKTLSSPFQFRLILILGVLLYLSFLPFDYYLFNANFPVFLLLRTGIFLPIITLVYFMSYQKSFGKRHRYYICGSAAFFAYTISLMDYLGRGGEYGGVYFYCIALVLIFFYGTGKVTVRPSVVTGLLIFIPCVWVDAVFVESDPLISLYKAIFLLSVMLFGIVNSATIQYSSRKRYWLHQKIEQLSLTDNLTGAFNRHYFEKMVREDLTGFLNTPPEKIRNGSRHDDKKGDQQTYYGIFLIDIDHFKKVNDTFGHRYGDQVLIELSKRIGRIIRKEDIFIRWGGEEFLIILKYINEPFCAEFIRRIRDSVSSTPFEPSGKQLDITVSGGVILASPEQAPDHPDAERLIHIADKALYHAKTHGRNRFIRAVCSGTDGSCIEYHQPQ